MADAVQDDGDGAGPGEVVTLLGEDYTVGVDPLGWPQLIADDGSVFCCDLADVVSEESPVYDSTASCAAATIVV